MWTVHYQMRCPLVSWGPRWPRVPCSPIGKYDTGWDIFKCNQFMYWKTYLLNGITFQVRIIITRIFHHHMRVFFMAVADSLIHIIASKANGSSICYTRNLCFPNRCSLLCSSSFLVCLFYFYVGKSIRLLVYATSHRPSSVYGHLTSISCTRWFQVYQYWFS